MHRVAAWSRRHASANNSALNVEKRKGSTKCSCHEWHVTVAAVSGDAVSCKSAPREGGPMLIHIAGHEKKRAPGPCELRALLRDERSRSMHEA